MARILVVDDAAFARARIKEILTTAGHEVLEAENGRLGVETYARERPDAVVMDVTMPEMDGIEAVQRIREQDPAARVVMLSAMGQKARIVEAIRRGASDFIVKPLQPTRLLAALQRILT